MASNTILQNVNGKRKRKISEIVDVERVLQDFRRMSEEDSPDMRILWQELNDVKFVGSVTEANGEAHFVTGSKYMGTWDTTGMAGVGRYTMPHGVIFEGELRDGVFHGRGTLEWPQKQRIDGVWLRGKLQEKRYTFSDGLVFQEKDWDYCQFPDRRFFQSIQNGLNPAGKTMKTARQPTPVIHPFCYDTGDGIFNPDTLDVTSYKLHKVIRNPSKEETEWIKENCRQGTRHPVGCEPRLNENWSANPPNLPYSLPFSNDSPQSWWKRLTTFERDVEVKTDNEEPVLGGEDISSESCHCYEYGSSEESYSDLASAIADEDHCTCFEDPKNKIDIEKEEYAAFREIICDELSKYENLDLKKTICVAPHSDKTTIVDFTDYKSQTSWEDEFQDDLSDVIFEKQTTEIERLKILHDSSRSSLDENKLDMKHDEGKKKEKIKETEEAKEESGEVMMKLKEEEILQDSSKQEVDQKDKEARNADNQEGEELQEDSEKRKEEEKEKEETGSEEQKLEDETKKQHLQETEDTELDKDKDNDKDKVKGKDKDKYKGKDKDKDNHEGTKEDKLKTTDLAEKQNPDYAKHSEDEDKAENLESVKSEKGKLKTTHLEKQNPDDAKNLEHEGRAENLESVKSVKGKLKPTHLEKQNPDDAKNFEREGKAENLESIKSKKDKLKTTDLAEKQNPDEAKHFDDEDKAESLESVKSEKDKLKTDSSDTQELKESEIRAEGKEISEDLDEIEKMKEDEITTDSTEKKKLKDSAKKTAKDGLSATSGEMNDEAEMFSTDLFKSLPTHQKILKTRSSPQLQHKKKLSDQTGDLGFSGTFVAPRAKLEFVRKPCDPQLCLKEAPGVCVKYPEKYSAPPCKPKKAIEMVHLRVKSKLCHE